MAGTSAYKAVVAEKVKALGEADRYSGTKTGSAARTSTGGKAATAGSNDNAAKSNTSNNAEDDDSNPAVSYSTIVFFFDSFYNRLFEVAPGVRPLFKNSIKVQGRALVKMVGTAVTALDKLDVLVPALEQLATRHINYGVKVEHYGVTGEVLLYALEKVSGPENWTPEVAKAWLIVYSVMMSVMIPATQKAEAEAQKQASNTGCSGRSSTATTPESSSTSPAPHPLSEAAANTPRPTATTPTSSTAKSDTDNSAPVSAISKMDPIDPPVEETPVEPAVPVVESVTIEPPVAEVPAVIDATVSPVVEAPPATEVPATETVVAETAPVEVTA